MFKAFGRVVMLQSECDELNKIICNQAEELARLREIERKYKALTDRDENGRYKK